MPIITEKYSNPQYGFLQGLGAPPAAPSVPILLADPKTGKFSNTRFEALKKVLIDELARAKSDYEKTLKAAEDECGATCRFAISKLASDKLSDLATAKKAAYNVRKSLLDNTKPRLERFEAAVRASWNSADPIWKTPAAYEAVLKGIRTEVQSFQVDANTLKVGADMTFYNALVDQAMVVLDNLYKAGAGVIGPAVWLAQNLPWILGVGAVLLIAGPTIAGAVKGGRSGAADAFASDVSRARGAIASGAKGATKLFGAPKRRVSRRRRR